MKVLQRGLLSAIIVMSSWAVALAQAPAGQKGAAPPRLVLSVTSTAWPDGGEVPMRNAGRGENKSPAFEFHWNLGTNPGAAPESLQTYAFNPGRAGERELRQKAAVQPMAQFAAIESR